MYTPAVLLDIHTRAQHNLAVLLGHCGGLTNEQLHQRIDGFGMPTIAVQFFHIIVSEQFWLSVLRGDAPPEDRRSEFSTVPLLEDYRQQVAQLTFEYLQRTSDEELSTRRRFEVDPGEFDDLRPVDVFMRCVTHQYHHQGQVLAMCRLLGHPRDDDLGVDYSLD